jgi:hypothetical protein
MKNSKIQVGDKVEILLSIFHLEHRKKPWVGFVTNVNGENLKVRPTWCKWEAHLYINEVRKI